MQPAIIDSVVLPLYNLKCCVLTAVITASTTFKPLCNPKCQIKTTVQPLLPDLNHGATLSAGLKPVCNHMSLNKTIVQSLVGYLSHCAPLLYIYLSALTLLSSWKIGDKTNPGRGICLDLLPGRREGGRGREEGILISLISKEILRLSID